MFRNSAQTFRLFVKGLNALLDLNEDCLIVFSCTQLVLRRLMQSINEFTLFQSAWHFNFVHSLITAHLFIFQSFHVFCRLFRRRVVPPRISFLNFPVSAASVNTACRLSRLDGLVFLWKYFSCCLKFFFNRKATLPLEITVVIKHQRGSCDPCADLFYTGYIWLTLKSSVNCKYKITKLMVVIILLSIDARINRT